MEDNLVKPKFGDTFFHERYQVWCVVTRIESDGSFYFVPENTAMFMKHDIRNKHEGIKWDR